MCSTVLAGAVCEANIDLYCGTVTFVVDIDWSGTAVALVWYCPVCSQYRLVCPENVADLLHLGFIFNFPSDWVENGGNRRYTSKREKEDEEIFRSWKTTRRIIHKIIHLNVLWFGSNVPNELFKIQLREIISLCYCPFVIAIELFFSTLHVMCLSMCI